MTQDASSTLGVGRQDFPELDTFRGIAALLMIVNHAGFRLLSPADATTGLSGSAVFVGSFAPVLFFFATGFGIALSKTESRRPWIGSLAWKAALLMLADQFFAWRNGWAWGFDFFAFIAFATVAVTLISRLRKPLPICVALVFLLLGVRYGVAPMFRDQLQHAPLVNWLTGVNGVDRVSYPLAPWFVYPLLGFLAGSLHRLHPRAGAVRVVSIAVLLSVGSLVVALGLALANGVFFRWGTVSLGYFVLSVGVLSTGVWIAMWLNRNHPAAASAIGLRGVASFAVIPLHYVMLDMCFRLLPLPLAPWPFLFTTALVVWASLTLAALLAAQLGRQSTRPLATTPLGVGLFVLAMAANRGGVLEPGDLGMASICFAGQLVVACLLGMGPTRRPTVPASA